MSDELEECPICGEPTDDQDARLCKCVECGREGYDSCCMTAGNGTACIECEEKDEA